MTRKIRVNIKPSMSKTQIRNEINRGFRQLERELINEIKRKLR